MEENQTNGHKLYVGNLVYQVTEQQIKDLFSQVGEVTEVALIKDRETGRAKGFGFVTMATKEGADAAIAKFNGYDYENRKLTVNEARPREEGDRPRSSGGNRSWGNNSRRPSGGSDWSNNG